MNPTDFTALAPGTLVTSPQGHVCFLPDPLPPKLSLSMAAIQSLAEAERALGKLAGAGEMLPNPHLLIGPFVRREAVLSSRIEGTVANEEDLVLFNVDPEVENRRPDAREVRNYITALEHGLKCLPELPVSLKLLKEVHSRLLKGVRGENKSPGEFRDRQNFIGTPGMAVKDARFVPPPVKEMHEALAAFEKFLRAPSERPFLVDLALLHYQFEAIHPFRDGNGRVGRLLIPLLLCERKILTKPLLYLSAYLEQHRTRYMDLMLAVSQKGEWQNWIAFFLRGIAEQAMDGVERATKLMALWQDYRKRLQTARMSILAQNLVDQLFQQPAMNVGLAQKLLEVSFASAQNNVMRLVSMGILKEVTGRKRDRIFIAPEILQLTGASHLDE
jgi:cell filamentation protein, protein adenylyltransferase